jgi:uncharacterized protein involved in exopolysaccharide biosynthesis
MNASPPSADRPASDEGFDVLKVIVPLWRGKWFILLAALLGTANAIHRSYKKKPVFKAETILAPVAEGSPGPDAGGFAAQFGGLASIVGVNLGGASPNVNNNLAIFKSREFAKEFVRKYKLMPVLFDSASLARTGKDSITLMDGAQVFSDQVGITLDKGLVTLTVKWSDPVVAAKWANDLVDYINNYLRTKSISEAEASIEYLRGEILKTPVATMQEMLNRLIEKQIQVIALAKVRKQYAFSVIDYATPPKRRISPKRAKDAATGLALGLALSVALVFGRIMVLNLRSNYARITGRAKN